MQKRMALGNAAKLSMLALRFLPCPAMHCNACATIKRPYYSMQSCSLYMYMPHAVLQHRLVALFNKASILYIFKPGTGERHAIVPRIAASCLQPAAFDGCGWIPGFSGFPDSRILGFTESRTPDG